MDTTTRNGDWMNTSQGIKFWPIDPRPEEVDIRDIAHALSMMCRYNGHCKNFYSVAEHSVLISYHVPAPVALWALLHDASEAYLADIVRPAKRYIAGYVEAEERLMGAICTRFGLGQKMPDAVKRADSAILVDEMHQLIANPAGDWELPLEGLGVKVGCWMPDYARIRFMERFNELYRE